MSDPRFPADPPPQPPTLDPKTLAALAVSLISALAAAAGHALSDDDQSQLLAGATMFATSLTVISPIFAAWFHKLHVDKLKGSTSS